MVATAPTPLGCGGARRQGEARPYGEASGGGRGSRTSLERTLQFEHLTHPWPQTTAPLFNGLHILNVYSRAWAKGFVCQRAAKESKLLTKQPDAATYVFMTAKVS